MKPTVPSQSAAFLERPLEDAAEMLAAPPVLQPAANENLPAPAVAPGRQRFPCSLEQKRFWVLNQLHPGNPALHVAARWRLEGEIATADLEHAFREILARHPILRSSFSESDGEPFQTVEPLVPFRIPEIDLSTLAATEAEVEAQRIAELEARASFDLRSTPPFIRVTRLVFDRHVSTLLVVAHHIVCDAGSLAIVAAELCEICAARQAGREPSLPRLSMSYGDFASWQSEFLDSESAGADTGFWRKTLAGHKHFEMPVDRQRPPVQTSNGRIFTMPLDRAIGAALTGLGRRHGCTLFVTTLTALLTLLHRYTGENDIGVGTQVAVRDDAELEPLVGLFVNTLVLRNDLSGDPDFETLLGRVRDAVAAAFQHRHMPLEHAISIVRPQRDLSRNPLFSINFVLHRPLAAARDYGRFRLVELPPVSCGAMYDLNFLMVEQRDGTSICCEYNTDLFEPETVRRLLSCFGTLLRGIAEDPARRISELPVLTAADRRALLVDWNATAAPYPRDRTVVHLFAEQAARNPDAPAISCERTLTYRELDEASSRLAHALRARGVGPGKIAGVMLNRSTDLVVALMATLKAGGAYAPIDPSHPPERIAYVASHSGLATLITRSTLTERLAGCAAPTLLIDEEAAALAAHPSTPPAPTATGDDCAYVLYTSGSTGKPKGVQIGHRSLVNVLWASRREPGLSDRDTYLSVTTIAFDVATMDVFLPLIVGAHLVLATEDQAASPEELKQLLATTRATTMFATPVTWQFLIEAGWKSAPGFKAICGGEAISRRLAEGILAGGGELWNIYGPTETTIWSSVLKIERGHGAVPIGAPIANTQFYILDPHLQPVPPGAPGELYIGGDGVGLGYLGRPELTAERFLPDPFRDAPNARIYRTGDIVRLRRDRNLDYLGRGDSQIKLRGFRIELGEIEAVLLAQAEVAEAVVVVGQDLEGEKAILAYAVPRAGAPSQREFVAGLRRAIGRSLPRYMMPGAFVVLDALPRLPNGKIDRTHLPPPVPAAAEADAAPAAETLNETESRIAQIWRSVLDVRHIGASDNFFELGGHSLLASRVLARIKTEFGAKLPLSAFFNAPTVQQLARVVKQDSQREYDFRQIVKLQANGTRPPLLAINNTGIYYQLSKRLGPEQPFTSLQLFDPSLPNATLPATFEEIAAGYVELIRRVQPRGPYSLLGWCVAGTLAYEIGRQLREQGEEVSQLVMIDTYVPRYLEGMPRWRRLLANLQYRWKLIALDWSKVLAGQQTFLTFLAHRNIVKKWSLRFGLLPAEGGERAEERGDESYDQWLVNYLQDRSERYAPRRYPGTVTLFRSAEEPHGRFLDFAMGWRAHADRVEVVTIEGDHFSIFRDPGVSRMAQHISEKSNGTPSASSR